ncbi:hypothetical protein H257_03937 [Aphanomyces astaci]|uniref:Uncharacterized protein n=1 Tax=Aphanomyces astaci TaxID=112090 RepID=W4GYQ8_APHAT|nr:hypothetical protein H257_03937 [Aphanomyces astaci]ETV84870.1 hypothetical protein H257_03937 [Aphanomyces astaci]|eukprot:XP_009826562.1 hypothetical protein H257_03937 [Aphanomyces astaci]
MEFPLQAVVAIHRECTTLAFDTTFVCNTNAIHSGSTMRALLFLGTSIVSSLIFFEQLRGSSPVMRPPTLTAPCTVADPPTVAPTSWWSSLLLVVGFAYIVGTLASSVMYLMVLEGKMSNDFWWQGFNSTGGHRFLASLLTSQYKTGDMDLTALPIYGAFNTTNDAVDFSLPHSMNIPSTSIDQRRHTGASLHARMLGGVPWLATQYCWVDFDRKWELANSRLR